MKLNVIEKREEVNGEYILMRILSVAKKKRRALLVYSLKFTVV